jgi:uncharacterized cupin superfamily protein
MAGIEQKSFDAPDDVLKFEKGKAELLKFGRGVVRRFTLMPGWHWSEHVRPFAGTELCESPRFQYHVSGSICVRTRDGVQAKFCGGEVTTLCAGHDAWVEGTEPAVIIDWSGTIDYAAKRPSAVSRECQSSSCEVMPYSVGGKEKDTASVEQKSFTAPDAVRPFENGRCELLEFNRGVVGRLVLKPGWRWSQHVRHIVGTELCEAPHFFYHVSGRFRVLMRDGTQVEAGPGDVSALAAGHDAWVVGEDSVVLIDWAGAVNYAKKPEDRVPTAG